MKKLVLIIASIVALNISIHTQTWPRTDRNIAPKPALPTLPVAGGTYVDPTFSSTILRLTDSNTQPGVVTSYRTPSETLTREWSSDGTRLYAVLTGGGVQAFSFNPASFTATPTIQLAFDAEPEWSIADPNMLIGRSTRNVDEACIKRYRFDTGLYDVVVGVRDLVPNVDANGRTYLRGYNTGGTPGYPEMLSFIFGGLGQDNDHYAAYGPLGGPYHLLDSVAGTLDGQPAPAPFSWGFYLHASAMDFTGRYVMLGPVNSQPYNNIIWDTTTNTFTPMTVHGGGHGALGAGQFINSPDDNDGSQTLLRNITSLNTVTELIQPYPSPSDFGVENHLSWANAGGIGLGDQNQFVFASWYRIGSEAVTREWDGEIDAISPSAPPTLVQRFAHHRSDTRHDQFPLTNLCFWATPRVNVSRDGKFAAFTSNMEKTLGPDPGDAQEGCGFRQDVWIIKLF